MRFALSRFTLLAAVLLPSVARPQTVCSKKLTPQQLDTRIDILISQMTIAERIAQLGDRAPAIDRLHIPAYNWWNEGLHGIARNGDATVFPQAIGLAASWDPTLLHSVGDTVSTEARAKFNPHSGSGSLRFAGVTIWSPNINIFRDPRWGRGQETYGEDPFLTASLGTQFVEGLQGSDSFYLKTVATPKHFAAHSGPEQGRDSFNTIATPHDLADTYLPAFHSLLTQGHADSLMCSYNAINGTPSCAKSAFLQDMVRNEWHFPGFIVSDCDAVGNLTEYQHFTADNAHGAADALNAGVDLDCGNTYAALQQSFDQHLVSEATINQSLHRLLLARFRLGLFDAASCSPYNIIEPSANDTPAGRALALRAAEESIVLLKNDGTLPLSPASRIAVIGPTADSIKILEANYHGTASHPVTPLVGLRESFKNISYAQGSLLATGVYAPIPSTALRTSTEPKAAQGLTAEFFSEPSLNGKPTLTITVPKIDLDLDRATPDPRITTPHYSARWSGAFVPPAPGDYSFRLNIERCWDCTSHDRFRLFLDDKLTLDNDGSKPEPNLFTLHATDTNPQALRIELFHTSEDAGIALEWQPPAQALLDEAVQAAQDADTIVALVGLSPDLEGEAFPLQIDGFSGGDRTSLDLPAAQVTLLHRLQQLHKPLVIVLTSGSAVALDPATYGANALLEAWYPGEEGGHAIANLLTGKVSPSGRLPVTFYRSVADLPAFSDYSMAHRTYRYFDGPVLFPFGFGLSYTHFSYSQPRLTKTGLQAGQPLTATVTLRNTGTTASEEVAELYLAPPQNPGAPRLTLQGTQRVKLNPGESRELTFTLTPRQLSFVDPAGHRAERAGDYRLFIGGSQPNPDTAGTVFHISGEQPFDF
jgi:beta-glucosidase